MHYKLTIDECVTQQFKKVLINVERPEPLFVIVVTISIIVSHISVFCIWVYMK